jgi:hypothetical protein
VTGSFIPVLNHAGQNYFPLALWTNGRAEIQFKSLSRRPPFDDVRLRREFLRRLNQIAGVSVPEDAVTRVPSIRLAPLVDSREALDSFRKCSPGFVRRCERTGRISLIIRPSTVFAQPRKRRGASLGTRRRESLSTLSADRERVSQANAQRTASSRRALGGPGGFPTAVLGD